jgi:hypothetical protein
LFVCHGINSIIGRGDASRRESPSSGEGAVAVHRFAKALLKVAETVKRVLDLAEQAVANGDRIVRRCVYRAASEYAVCVTFEPLDEAGKNIRCGVEATENVVEMGILGGDL